MKYNEKDVERMYEAIKMSSTSADWGESNPQGRPFGAVICKDDKCIAKS